MSVLPPRERADDLLISKADAVGERVMFRNPTLTERTDPHQQFGSFTIGQRPNRVNHFETLPRRKQSIKRTGPSVPSQQLLGRGGHQTALEELGHDDSVA